MRKFLEKAVIPYTAICTTLIIVICWYAIEQNHNTLPFWDSWDGYIGYMLRFEEMSGPQRTLSLFEQHNEHRFFFTRLLFIFDFYVFNASFTPLYIFNALVPLIPVLVIYAALKNVDRFSRILITLVSASILFSLQQKENFYWEFQSQFFLAQYVPFLGYYLIVRFWSASLRHNLARLIAMAVVSAFTMVNGLFFALPLVIILITHKEHRTYALAAAVVFAAIYAFYFHILPYREIVGHGSLRTDVLPDLGRYLSYISTYVGSPFGSVYARGMGGLFIITALTLFWQSLENKPVLNLSLVFLLYIIFYGISVAATGVGRVNFGTAQALGERYLTPTLLAWVCMVILLITKIQVIEYSKKLVASTAVIISSLLLHGQFFEARQDYNKQATRELTRIALALGISDTETVQTVYPVADYVISTFKKSDAQNLSFTQFGARWPEIGSANASVTASCLGAIDHVISLGDDFLRVEGWIIDPASQNALMTLVYLEDGTVKGLGQRGLSRPDVANAHGPLGTNSGFRIFIDVSDRAADTGAIQSATLEVSCSLEATFR